MIQYGAVPYVIAWLGLAGILRKFLGSWLTPPAYCALYWGILATVNLFFPDYPMGEAGLLYILEVLSLFGLGHLLSSKASVHENTIKSGLAHPRERRFPAIRITLVTCAIASATYTMLIAKSPEIDIANPPLYLQLLLTLQFFGPMLGGVAVGLNALDKKDKWYAALTLVGSFMLSVGFGGRTAFIGPLLLLTTAYLAGTICLRPHQTPLISLKRLAYVSVAVAALSVYATAVYTIRGALSHNSVRTVLEVPNLAQVLTDPDKFSRSFDNVGGQLEGQVGMFTQVFVQFWRDPAFTPNWGRYSLMGPIKLLGLREAENNPVYYGPNVAQNVYTIFPPALQDFGVTGSFVYWLFLGLISGYFWERARRGWASGCMVVLFILMNLQIGTTFMLRYNSVILAYLYCLIYAGYSDSQRSRHLSGTSGRQRFGRGSLPSRASGTLPYFKIPY
jgi:hypothetical protein